MLLPISAGTNVKFLIQKVRIPTAAAGVAAIPIELYSYDAGGAVLEAKVVFDIVSPYL